MGRRVERPVCQFEHDDKEERIGEIQGREGEERREEEITFDLILGAKGNVQADKANGPEDIIVMETLKELCGKMCVPPEARCVTSKGI